MSMQKTLTRPISATVSIAKRLTAVQVIVTQIIRLRESARIADGHHALQVFEIGDIPGRQLRATTPTPQRARRYEPGRRGGVRTSPTRAMSHRRRPLKKWTRC